MMDGSSVERMQALDHAEIDMLLRLQQGAKPELSAEEQARIEAEELAELARLELAELQALHQRAAASMDDLAAQQVSATAQAKSKVATCLEAAVASEMTPDEQASERASERASEGASERAASEVAAAASAAAVAGAAEVAAVGAANCAEVATAATRAVPQDARRPHAKQPNVWERLVSQCAQVLAPQTECAIVACLGPDPSLSDICLVELSEFPQALLDAAHACLPEQETVPRVCFDHAGPSAIDVATIMTEADARLAREFLATAAQHTSVAQNIAVKFEIRTWCG